MAGTIIVSSIKTDTDNSFIVRSNTGATLFSVDTTSISIPDGSITSAMIANGTVIAADVADGSVTNAKLAGSITSDKITSVSNTAITGNPLFSAGSNTAPSITTSGDTNTGMFFPAADTIAFAEGGIEAMRLDANGNIGIGTTSPASSLDVQATSGVSMFRLTATTGTNAVYSRYSNTGGFLYLGRDNSSGTDFGSAYAAGIWSTGAYPMLFGTNGTEKMRISSSGDVGIGTTSPDGRIHGQLGDTNGSVSWNRATFASYADTIMINMANRAQTSAYNFLINYSSSGSDIEQSMRGDGNAFADGSWGGGGADYAEYFEWADGNSDDEDRRGYSVVLEGNKIRKAESGETPIGVISANPAVVGDTAFNKWSEKYLRDDFGSYILENYTVTEWFAEGDQGSETYYGFESDKIPVGTIIPESATTRSTDDDGKPLKRRTLNPSYDETQSYIPREERKEWDTVGLMGKLRLRKGQPVAPSWIKMRDVSSSVEEWLVK